MPVRFLDEEKPRVRFLDEEPAQEAPDKNTWDESVAARGQAVLDGVLLGFGDEAGAGVRTGVSQLLSALDPNLEVENWSDLFERELSRGREIEQKERKESGNTMLALEVAGGLFGGGKLAKAAGLGSKATRAGNVATGAGVGAGEAALYGFGEGEGGFTNRLENIDPYMTAFGGAVGGFAGSWLRGTSEEVTDKAIRNRSSGDINKAYSSSNQQVQRGELEVGERTEEAARSAFQGTADFIGDATTRLKTWTGENVGRWAERGLVDAEGQAMREIAQTMQRLDKAGGDKSLRNLESWFEKTNTGQLAKKYLHDMTATDSRGVVFSPESRKATFEKLKATMKDAPEGVRKTFDAMYDEVRRVKDLDPTWKATGDYFPTLHLEGAGGVSTGDYASPVAAFINYFDDVITANKLATRFGVSAVDTKAMRSAEDLRKYANKLSSKGKPPEQVNKAIARLIRNNSKSNTERVISAIGNKYDEISPEQNANLREALTSAFVRGRKSPHEALRVTRALANSSQLARLSNIILNASEIGVTATNYGVASTLKALPGAIRSAFTNTDKIIDDFGNTIRMSDLGVTGQYMNEVATNKNNVWDKLTGGLFSVSGVRKWNTLQQETSVNAAKNKAVAFSKAGKLDKMKAARGLTKKEIQNIQEQFKNKNFKHPDVLDFVFREITDVQPISRSSMPKAFNDHPNGRVFYSMLSFMSQQSNLLREEVWQKTAKAYRHGLNTKEGRQALKEATQFGAKYVALTAGLAGYFDDNRKVLRGDDVEYDPVESTINQMAQLATFGVVQPRAEQWGGSTVSLLNPAPISAVEDVLSVGANAALAPITDEEFDGDKALRTLQRWTPGIANMDDFYRYMTDGERLLID